MAVVRRDLVHANSTLSLIIASKTEASYTLDKLFRAPKLQLDTRTCLDSDLTDDNQVNSRYLRCGGAFS